jgi:hypothetical protein
MDAVKLLPSNDALSTEVITTFALLIARGEPEIGKITLRKCLKT